MSSAQVILSGLVKAALVATLVGIYARGRWRECLAFPLYLGVVLACDTLVSLWPDRFYVHWFWSLQQSLWDLAKLGVALELGFRIFQSFPGARRRAQVALAAILALTTLLTTAPSVSLRPRDYYTSSALDWQPHLLSGTIWLMTALALLVVWYRLPIRDFQRAILVGFVPYLVVFVTLLNILRREGWEIRPWVNLADAGCYLLASLWWAYSAWSPQEQLEVSPAVLRRLGLETP